MGHAPGEILVPQENVLPRRDVIALKRCQRACALFEGYDVIVKSFLKVKHVRAVKFRKITSEIPIHDFSYCDMGAGTLFCGD